MPSIVIINDLGDVLYQNIFEDSRDLAKMIHEKRLIPDYLAGFPKVQINGLIVIAGQPPKLKKVAPKLSERQISVLQLLAKAFSPEQIALRLGISEATVRLHMKILKKKFGTDSRDQMMAMAGQLGLCDPFFTNAGQNEQEW